MLKFYKEEKHENLGQKLSTEFRESHKVGQN